MDKVTQDRLASQVKKITTILNADGVSSDAIKIGGSGTMATTMLEMLNGNILYWFDIEQDMLVFNQYGGIFVRDMSTLPDVPECPRGCMDLDDWLDSATHAYLVELAQI